MIWGAASPRHQLSQARFAFSASTCHCDAFFLCFCAKWVVPALRKVQVARLDFPHVRGAEPSERGQPSEERMGRGVGHGHTGKRAWRRGAAALVYLTWREIFVHIPIKNNANLALFWPSTASGKKLQATIPGFSYFFAQTFLNLHPNSLVQLFYLTNSNVGSQKHQ